MKKVISIVMAIMMVFGLCACGGRTPAAQESQPQQQGENMEGDTVVEDLEDPATSNPFSEYDSQDTPGYLKVLAWLTEMADAQIGQSDEESSVLDDDQYIASVLSRASEDYDYHMNDHQWLSSDRVFSPNVHYVPLHLHTSSVTRADGYVGNEYSYISMIVTVPDGEYETAYDTLINTVQGELGLPVSTEEVNGGINYFWIYNDYELGISYNQTMNRDVFFRLTFVCNS